MVLAAALAVTPLGQYCADLDAGQRVLCNQMADARAQLKEVGGKLDTISQNQNSTQRQLDVLGVRVETVEERTKILQIDVGTLQTWREELMAKLAVFAAIGGLLIPVVTSWLNRRWAKLEKGRWGE